MHAAELHPGLAAWVQAFGAILALAAVFAAPIVQGWIEHRRVARITDEILAEILEQIAEAGDPAAKAPPIAVEAIEALQATAVALNKELLGQINPAQIKSSAKLQLLYETRALFGAFVSFQELNRNKVVGIDDRVLSAFADRAKELRSRLKVVPH